MSVWLCYGLILKRLKFLFFVNLSKQTTTFINKKSSKISYEKL